MSLRSPPKVLDKSVTLHIQHTTLTFSMLSFRDLSSNGLQLLKQQLSTVTLNRGKKQFTFILMPKMSRKLACQTSPTEMQHLYCFDIFIYNIYFLVMQVLSKFPVIQHFVFGTLMSIQEAEKFKKPL